MDKSTFVYKLWPGRAQFLMDGQYMLGGGSNIPLYLLSGTIALAHTLFFVVVYPLGPASVVFDLAAWSLWGVLAGLVWALCMTVFRDPGILPRELSVEGADEVDRSQPLPNESRKYCITCKIIRPQRASHCSICDHCIFGFDHHCGWLNVCIAKLNHKHFILVTVFGALYATMLFLDCSWVLLAVYSRDDPASLFSKTPSQVMAQSQVFWDVMLPLTGVALFVGMCCRRCFYTCRKGWRQVPWLVCVLVMFFKLVWDFGSTAGGTLLVTVFIVCSLSASASLVPFALYNLYLVGIETTKKQMVVQMREAAAYTRVAQQDTAVDQDPENGIPAIPVQPPKPVRKMQWSAIFRFLTTDVPPGFFNARETVDDYLIRFASYDPAMYE